MQVNQTFTRFALGFGKLISTEKPEQLGVLGFRLLWFGTVRVCIHICRPFSTNARHGPTTFRVVVPSIRIQ